MRHQLLSIKSVAIAIVLATTSLGGQQSSAAKIVRTANNGMDTLGYGTETLPCRSINRALSIAAAGDTVLVGPGRYGDLNENGIFGETGEETLQPVATAVPVLQSLETGILSLTTSL